jgi:hypothetical protein
MKKEFEQEQIGTSPTIAPHGGTEDTEKRILLRQGFHLRLAYGGQEGGRARSGNLLWNMAIPRPLGLHLQRHL